MRATDCDTIPEISGASVARGAGDPGPLARSDARGAGPTPWLARVDLGDGHQLQLRLADNRLELRIGDDAIALPTTALPDIVGALSKASCEATWRSSKGHR